MESSLKPEHDAHGCVHALIELLIDDRNNSIDPEFAELFGKLSKVTHFNFRDEWIDRIVARHIADLKKYDMNLVNRLVDTVVAERANTFEL